MNFSYRIWKLLFAVERRLQLSNMPKHFFIKHECSEYPLKIQFTDNISDYGFDMK